jgi:LysM repeat protein
MPAPSGGRHAVALGETLYSIARHYGTTISALLAANGISNPDYIYAGQVLVIPGAYSPPPVPKPPVYQPPVYHPPAQHCGTYYHVKPGDTLSGIAAYHGTTVQAIAYANGLKYPYIIHAGQQLHIPCGGAPPHYPPSKPPAKPAPKPTAKPSLRPAACAREVQIVRPLEGAHVSGVVQVIGTANIPDFQFYKVEYAAGHNPLDSAFHSINDVFRTPASDTVLATWFVGNLAQGPYTLRLTAVDQQGQFVRPCDVHVHVN